MAGANRGLAGLGLGGIELPLVLWAHHKERGYNSAMHAPIYSAVWCCDIAIAITITTAIAIAYRVSPQPCALPLPATLPWPMAMAAS